MNFKHFSFLCVLVLAILKSSIGFAQEISQASYEGDQVLSSVIKGDKKSFQKAWCKLLEDSYKAKTKRRGNSVSALDFVMSDISTVSVNSKMYVEKGAEDSNILKVYFHTTFADNSPIGQNNTPSEFSKLSFKLESFLKRYQYDYLSGLLEEKSKSLSKAEKDFNKLQTTNTKLEKSITESLRSIEKAQKRMDDAKKTIEDNNAKMVELRKQIDQKQLKIQELEENRAPKN